jgi:hypothetical protein
MTPEDEARIDRSVKEAALIATRLAAIRAIANDLSWSSKTRALSARVFAALDFKEQPQAGEQ